MKEVLSAIENRCPRTATGRTRTTGALGEVRALRVRVRASLFNLSPGGTAESSPGRQSWDTYMWLTSPRDNPQSSIPPRGDMFSAAIPIVSRTYPGLASWDILSRPCGTTPALIFYPGLASWATLSRPLRDYSCSHFLPRTYVLGYSQPPLRDLILNPRSSRRHSKPMSRACRNMRNKREKRDKRDKSPVGGRREGKKGSHTK